MTENGTLCNHKRAYEFLEEHSELNVEEKLILLKLLDTIVKAEAILASSAVGLRSLISRHSQTVMLPVLTAPFDEKPVYMCTMENEHDDVAIGHYIVMLDTDNTAVDLILSWKLCRKLHLTPSSASPVFASSTDGSVSLTRMLPSVLVTFPLRDSQGTVTEKIASLDAYCSTTTVIPLKGDKRKLHPVSMGVGTRKLVKCAASSTQVAEGLGTVIGAREPSTQDEHGQDDQESEGAEEEEEEDEEVQEEPARGNTSANPSQGTINDPAPFRYVASGEATLGASGQAKLRLAYDSAAKMVLPSTVVKPMPEITGLTRL